MKTIEIRLHRENTILAGFLEELEVGTKEHPFQVLCPRWTCPCGTEIRTATMPVEDRHLVTGGYGVNCPGCRRWFMHHTVLGCVSG